MNSPVPSSSRQVSSIGMMLLVATIVIGCVQINGQTDTPSGTNSFSVQIAHPGNEIPTPTPCTLFTKYDPGGFPAGYCMDVDSVICEDEVCEIIAVRIHWDLLGNYLRYELPEGGNLTKKDHHAFTLEDHEKLHAILSNSESPLKWVTRDQIVAPEKAMQGMDGVSGATALSSGEAVVPGAAYTSYTLWHWANGEIQTMVRQITCDNSDREQLLHYLDSVSEDYALFAIDQFIEKSIHDPKVRDAVIQRFCEGSSRLVIPTFLFLKTIPADSTGIGYFQVMEKCFLQADSTKRIQMLTYLLDNADTPPNGYYDRISHWLPGLDIYYEIHLLLNFLERQSPPSPEVIDQVMKVLEQSNFLISRRAYWFLSDRDLSVSQQARLSAFEMEFSDRL